MIPHHANLTRAVISNPVNILYSYVNYDSSTSVIQDRRSSIAWTLGSGATISQVTSSSGPNSLRTTGTAGFTRATNPYFAVGMNDFTIGTSVYITGTNGAFNELFWDTRTTGTNGFIGAVNTTDRSFVVTFEGMNVIATATNSWNYNQWYDVRMTRTGNNLRLYVNKTLAASYTYSTAGNLTQTALTVSGRFEAVSGNQTSIVGHCDNFIFINGLADNDFAYPK